MFNKPRKKIAQVGNTAPECMLYPGHQVNTSHTQHKLCFYVPVIGAHMHTQRVLDDARSCFDDEYDLSIPLLRDCAVRVPLHKHSQKWFLW